MQGRFRKILSRYIGPTDAEKAAAREERMSHGGGFGFYKPKLQDGTKFYDAVEELRNHGRKDRDWWMIEVHGRLWKLSNNSLFIFRQELHVAIEVRKMALWVTEWPWFDRLIIFCIFINCVVMGLPASYNPDSAEEDEKTIFGMINTVCIILFTVECVLKLIARGAICSDAPDPCYMAQWSNVFDLAVVIAGIVELCINADGNPSKLLLVRSVRILRPLRTINKLPHLQMIVASLIDSTPRLMQWMTTVLFISTLFTIAGTSIFGTVYWHRCRLTPEPVMHPNGAIEWPVDPSQPRFCGGRFECETSADGAPTYCGSLVDPISGPRSGMDVWPEINDSPLADFGYSGFQSFLSGLMTIFRVATMEGWAMILYRYQDGRGDFLALVYFIGLLIYGGLVLLNLALAILWRSFEEKIRSHSQALKALAEHTIPPEIHVLKLDELVTKVHEIEAEHKSAKIYAAMDQTGGALASMRSISLSVVTAPSFDGIILFVIILNCVVLAIDAYPPPAKLLVKFTEQLNVFCTFVFTIEAVLRIISFGFKYFQDYFNVFDFALVIVSLVEMFIIGQSTVSALRVSRLLRIFKIFGQSVPMRVLFRVMGRATILSYNFCIIVVLVLVGWSLVAVHFFYDKYTGGAEENTQIKFESFEWAFIAMFQLLCGERWHETMIEHARDHDDNPLVSIFFVAVYISCHLILMNLFLGMFVAAFAIAREHVIDENRLKLKKYTEQAAEQAAASSPKKGNEPPPEPPAKESPRWPRDALKPRWYTKTFASDMNALRMLRVKRGAASRAMQRGDRLKFAATELEACAPPRRAGSGVDADIQPQKILNMPDISDAGRRPSKERISFKAADLELPASITANLLPSQEHRALPPAPLSIGTGGEGPLLDFEIAPRPPVQYAEAQVHQSSPPCALETDRAFRRPYNHAGLRYRHQANAKPPSFRQAYQSARLCAQLYEGSTASHISKLKMSLQAEFQAETQCAPHCREIKSAVRLCMDSITPPPSSRSYAAPVPDLILELPPGSHSKVGLAPEVSPEDADARAGLCADAEVAGIWLQDAPHSAAPTHALDSSSDCNHEILPDELCLPVRDVSRENCDSDFEASGLDHLLVPMGIHTAPPAPPPEPLLPTGRRLAHLVVKQALFEPAIMVLIGISSVCLAIETPYTKTDSKMFAMLAVIEKVVAVAFLLEMLLKIGAFGAWSPKVPSPTGDPPYFKTAWNWLDSMVVLTSIVDFIFNMATDAEDNTLRVVRAMRLLRVMRPLRLVRRNKGLRIIVEALIKSFPTLCRVLAVSSLFYIGFAILFMNLLKGELWRCSLDPSGTQRPDIVTRDHCLAAGGSWINARSHFDQIGSSIVTLLHVGTGEGWVEIMKDMVNSVGIDKQPRRNSRIHFSLGIISFVCLSRFFIVNLLIGVMIDQYCATRDIMFGVEMSSVEEKRWIQTQRQMLSVRDLLKPNFVIKGRFIESRLRINKWVFCQGADTVVLVMILVNSVILCLVHPTMGSDIRTVFDAGSVICIIFFNVEVALKCFVRLADYFADPWNVFDFIVIIGSDASMFAEAFKTESAPDITQVLHAFRVMRVIRLVRVCGFLRKQCATLLQLVPAFMNIGLLLILLLFLYACLGVGLFATVMPGQDLNHNSNFKSFWFALLVCLRVSTGENWQNIMYDVSEDRPGCTTDLQTPEELARDGPLGCGTFLAYPYFVSFTSFVSIIMMNMIVAVVLDQFQAVEQSASIEFYTEQVRMLGRRWRQQDEQLTGFLSIDGAIAVLLDVPPPIGFQDRTARRARHMIRNCPLFEKKVHIRDILMICTKRVYCWMHNEREEQAPTVKLDPSAVTYWLSIWPEIPKPDQAAKHFFIAHVIIHEYVEKYFRHQLKVRAHRAEQAAIKEEEDLERQMKSKGARAAAALLQAPNANQKTSRVLAGRNAAGLPLRMAGDQAVPSGSTAEAQELRLSADPEDPYSRQFSPTVLVGAGFEAQ